MSDILTEIRKFQDAAGLSDHRVGMVLARNGRLIERLENRRRIWPDTEDEIRVNLANEIKKRGLHGLAHGDSTPTVQDNVTERAGG